MLDRIANREDLDQIWVCTVCLGVFRRATSVQNFRPFTVVRLEFTKCLSECQTGRTLIRLLHKKQSDLGLHCLYRPFRKATSVQNCTTFAVTVYLFSL